MHSTPALLRELLPACSGTCLLHCMIWGYYAVMKMCVYSCQAPRTADTRLLRAAIPLDAMVSNTFVD